MSGEGGTRRDDSTLTVRVPMTFCRRGGRKAVVTPDGAATWAPRPRVDNTMVKALARAHRWKRMLESGDYASVAELAAAEKINSSYLSRVLRLTLLAPDIVQAILDGEPSEAITLDRLIKPFPVEWEEQRACLGRS